MKYNVKIVESGNITEVYQYLAGIDIGFDSIGQVGERIKSDDWSGKNERNLQRARQNLRRIVWSNNNKFTKFLTLTYKANMQDLKIFYKDWQSFTRNLKRNGIQLKYLYVIEYQERGAIHCHCVIFNQEYIPTKVIENAWGKGFVKLNCIKDVDNLGAYVCKYLTKKTLSEYCSKSYHTSRGLKKPIEAKKNSTTSNSAIPEKVLANKQETYHNTYIIPHIDVEGNKILDEAGEVKVANVCYYSQYKNK